MRTKVANSSKTDSIRLELARKHYVNVPQAASNNHNIIKIGAKNHRVLNTHSNVNITRPYTKNNFLCLHSTFRLQVTSK